MNGNMWLKVSEKIILQLLNEMDYYGLNKKKNE